MFNLSGYVKTLGERIIGKLKHDEKAEAEDIVPGPWTTTIDGKMYRLTQQDKDDLDFIYTAKAQLITARYEFSNPEDVN